MNFLEVLEVCYSPFSVVRGSFRRHEDCDSDKDQLRIHISDVLRHWIRAIHPSQMYDIAHPARISRKGGSLDAISCGSPIPRKWYIICFEIQILDLKLQKKKNFKRAEI